MYYLNSDGSPDTTVVDEFRSCHCDSCKKKRKRKQSWFTYTNIFLLIILIVGIIIMTVDSKQLARLFDFSSYGKSIASTPVTATTSSSSSSSDMSSKNTEAGFELPLL
jgi:hypothetical protein